jgi:hypothetical protein
VGFAAQVQHALDLSYLTLSGLGRPVCFGLLSLAS